MSWEQDQERYNIGLSDEVLVINELAAKYGYSRKVIKEAVESPMAFISDKMKEFDKDFKGPYPVFRIRKFGLFMPKWRYTYKCFKEKEDGEN